MTILSAVYNDLPTLEEADDRFTERDQTFVKVGSLLAQFGNVFGLCLVHAHCTLSDDEMMVGRGNVSQPEKNTQATEVYPERWLSSGQPYEFTSRPTVTPSAALFEAFYQLTSHIGVLGLYYIDKENKPAKMIEHTEGRKNILLPYTDADKGHEATQTLTAWDLTSLDPVTMACNKIIVCDSRTTREGAVHKGMCISPPRHASAAITLLIKLMKERSLQSISSSQLLKLEFMRGGYKDV